MVLWHVCSFPHFQNVSAKIPNSCPRKWALWSRANPYKHHQTDAINSGPFPANPTKQTTKCVPHSWVWTQNRNINNNNIKNSQSKLTMLFNLPGCSQKVLIVAWTIVSELFNSVGGDILICVWLAVHLNAIGEMVRNGQSWRTILPQHVWVPLRQKLLHIIFPPKNM